MTMRAAAILIAGYPARALVAVIRVYKFAVSPWLGPRCRYFPSCSEYATEAVDRFGVVRGGGRALRRLLRCHPLGPGGVDLVD